MKHEDWKNTVSHLGQTLPWGAMSISTSFPDNCDDSWVFQIGLITGKPVPLHQYFAREWPSGSYLECSHEWWAFFRLLGVRWGVKYYPGHKGDLTTFPAKPWKWQSEHLVLESTGWSQPDLYLFGDNLFIDSHWFCSLFYDLAKIPVGLNLCREI